MYEIFSRFPRYVWIWNHHTSLYSKFRYFQQSPFLIPSFWASKKYSSRLLWFYHIALYIKSFYDDLAIYESVQVAQRARGVFLISFALCSVHATKCSSSDTWLRNVRASAGLLTCVHVCHLIFRSKPLASPQLLSLASPQAQLRHKLLIAME